MTGRYGLRVRETLKKSKENHRAIARGEPATLSLKDAKFLANRPDIGLRNGYVGKYRGLKDSVRYDREQRVAYKDIFPEESRVQRTRGATPELLEKSTSDAIDKWYTTANKRKQKTNATKRKPVRKVVKKPCKKH